jgi:hypothetical protein
MRARIGSTTSRQAGVVATIVAGTHLLLAATGFVPAKGQAVYVAATLKEIRHKSGQPGGAKLTYDMAACEKLIVKKGKAGKRSWTVTDLMGNDVRLQGSWQPWMFKSKEECRDGIVLRGEAPVRKAGEVFTLSTAAPAK